MSGGEAGNVFEARVIPLKVHAVRLQAAMFKKLSSSAGISLSQISCVSPGAFLYIYIYFPLEIRPVLSPIKRERWEESRCS